MLLCSLVTGLVPGDQHKHLGGFVLHVGGEWVPGGNIPGASGYLRVGRYSMGEKYF